MPDRRVIRIVIPGEPKPKRAPRVGRIGKGENARPRLFAHPETAKVERNIRQFAVEAMADAGIDRPLTVPVVVTIRAYRSAGTKSMSHRMRADALADRVRPISRPDVDNYSKAALDAINGVVFLDDAQVVAELIVKMYSDRPRLEIVVAEWLPRGEERNDISGATREEK
jgi:Holliday junction resolvase RusA-like endonuclease